MSVDKNFQLWSDKVDDFLAFKERFLQQVNLLDASVDHVYHLHLDYTEILFSLCKEKDEDSKNLFRFHMKNYFVIVLFALDQILFLKTGRIIRQYQQEATVKSDIHPTKKDNFKHPTEDPNISLNILSLDGHNYLQSSLANEIKREWKVRTP